MSSTFLYFAYGSNLLAKRIRLNNATAVVRDIGYIKLVENGDKDYRIDKSTPFTKKQKIYEYDLYDTAVLRTNFRLDFQRYSKRWRGTSATIVETKDFTVWGVVWELDKSNLSTLDHQEGVHDKIYHAMSVDVTTPNGTTLNCRVYQQCYNPTEYIKLKDFPMDRKPSPLYLEMIIKGAEENNLPDNYIKFLKSIPNNGYEGEYDIR